MSSRKLKSAYAEYRDLVGLSPEDELPALVCIANAEDEATGEASEVYAFMKPAGRHGIVKVPREKAFSAESLAQAIIAKNGLLPRDRERAQKIVERASRQEPQDHWLYASRGGWQPGFRAFAHRGQIFGKGHVPGLILQPPASDLARSFPLAQVGKRTGWEQIMCMAHRSSRLRLAISATFAAPLLKLVELQSFTIVLAGQSKAGKSTALLAAGSVIGIGLEGALPNFNATTAALQEAAVEFIDRVLPVNELGLLKGSRKAAYEVLRPLTYRYSEGRDTARHSKSSYGREGATLEWRGIMLISSENTLEALAELAGEKRDEGEYPRAFDVPAVAKGCSTIFDRFPKFVVVADRDTWARGELVRLRQAVVLHHGHAFDTYAAFLVKHRRKVRRWTEKAMTEFMASLSGIRLSAALQHAARNFALLYAGACLARKAGLVRTWKQDATLKDLRQCFRDGLREIEQMQTAEERAVAKLLMHLRSVPPCERMDDVDAVEGWYDTNDQGRRVYKIRTRPFASWFTDQVEVRAAIRWLQRSQLLIVKDGAKPDQKVLEWAVTFPKLGGQGRRCYQFRDPASLA